MVKWNKKNVGYISVKINKGMQFKMELGTPERWELMHMLLLSICFTETQQEEERFSPRSVTTHPMRTPYNSASGKSSQLWIIAVLQWTFIQNNPFQLPSFSLCNVTFSPHLYLLDLLMVFAVACLSWIPIPYYSWINPFWGLNTWLLFLRSTLLGVRSGIQKWSPQKPLRLVSEQS